MPIASYIGMFKNDGITYKVYPGYDQNDKCWACGRPFKSHNSKHLVDTRDDQKVYVGPECYKKVVKAGDDGLFLEPGHPRLYLIK